jgi:hypothetical protein
LLRLHRIDAEAVKEVKVQIVGPNGKHGTLVTQWQIDNGASNPRLITNWLETHE